MVKLDSTISLVWPDHSALAVPILAAARAARRREQRADLYYGGALPDAKELWEAARQGRLELVPSEDEPRGPVRWEREA